MFMFLFNVLLLELECVDPEKIHTHPMEGHWNEKGGGVLTAKILVSKV